jgi:RimJ/RimL family protein N-acetyltransferase
MDVLHDRLVRQVRTLGHAATEAVEEVVRHGFEELGLHRIHADHFASNPASGRPMR